MNYLQGSEYEQFGLDTDTTEDLVRAASAMIDGFCRRPGLEARQYTERLRFAEGGMSVWLSYLPVAVVPPAASALVKARVRLNLRKQSRFAGSWLRDEALAFALPGTWSEVDVSMIEVSETGELSIAPHLFGLVYDEAEITYTAGWSVLPDAVKVACAQIVRNAQTTPGLNVKGTKVDAMQMEYFSGALLDGETKRLLKPFVATRLG
jgi:hypothetical protein